MYLYGHLFYITTGVMGSIVESLDIGVLPLTNVRLFHVKLATFGYLHIENSKIMIGLFHIWHVNQIR